MALDERSHSCGLNQRICSKDYDINLSDKHGKLNANLFSPTLWPEENAHSSLGELVQDLELIPRNEDVEFDDSDDEGERERERRCEMG